MKKLLAILLAAVLLLSLTACNIEGLLSQLGEGSPSGVTNTKKPELIGTWELVPTEDESSTTESTESEDNTEESEAVSDIEFGLGIEFTEDGKLRYGFSKEMLESIENGESIDETIDGMEMLITIYYDVKSDTEIELTVSAMMGMAKETQTVTYSLAGDTLVFDGTAYKRVK